VRITTKAGWPRCLAFGHLGDDEPQPGRWPGHEITKNICAPFIHSFIVDEWETTNLTPPSFSSRMMLRIITRSCILSKRRREERKREKAAPLAKVFPRKLTPPCIFKSTTV
jgi:hypothetical protein